jgi:hypothetical protein
MVAAHLSSRHKRYLFYGRGPLKQPTPKIELHL